MNDHSELKKSAEAAIEAGIESGERWPQDDDWFEPELISAELDYVKKATPTAVLALIAEVEGLRAQHGRDSAELRSLCQARDDARKERDQLKADNEALRRDAERYRWLRNGSDYSVAVHEGPELDKVIDRAMSEAAKR